ncbi:hypothetical protein CERSUDRAFT_119910 [Gelatoporia subvermispora B]|uniref:SUN domain-containing protein n=1 Tax=Ceriporiopsis subvermispora (strain B) TaxID=914234 RepID=M2P7P0_CERS8|nr:hypothetical protein CERSUDRAFT_119910 [Gelatoporia subvermispora B]
MSFASTPLGQGRRLDHHTFHNKPNPNLNRRANSPPRRAAPTSFAYGAPSLSTRSPPRLDRSGEREPLHEDPSDEPALVRFARLKQREQAQQQARPSTHAAASPHPEKWAVKDTSVQIASAFYQAATTADDSMPPPTNPNDSWTSGVRKVNVPRSSSVEYEKETQSTINRRLAPPPSRNAARAPRPVSKTQSTQRVPDSEGEEPEPDSFSRGKSPFTTILDAAKRLPPVEFLLRQRSQEPEGPQDRSNGSHHMHEHSSYEYSTEEREYQEASKSARRTNGTHKRGKISEDNRAYRPSMSDVDESDEYISGDDKRTRRKKTKKGAGVGGPPLTSLPVVGQDKRRKRKRKSGQANGDQDEDQEGESSSEENVGEQHSIREASILRGASLARGSARGSLPPDYTRGEDTMMVEQQLGPISEEEEDEPPLAGDTHLQPTRPSFSIGAALGRGVNRLFRLAWTLLQLVLSGIAVITRFIGRILGFSFDLIIHKPARAVSRIDPVPLAKYISIALIIYAACYALQRGWLDLPSLPSPTRQSKPFEAPDIPASDLTALSARLQRIENVVAGLSLDTERSRVWHEGDVRNHAELAGRLGSLESRIEKESRRNVDVESSLRASSMDGLRAISQEVTSLRAQVQAQEQKQRETPSTPAPTNDEEARAKLRALEERVGSVESGVKEAIELGKNAGSGASWLQKLASGATGVGSVITLKSADSIEVNSLVSQMVDDAVWRVYKDDLARPDWALNSAGALVIPSLTSETLEVRPESLVGQLTGVFTGKGYAMGRPPVTALHPDTHNGHCWPFVGTRGQLAVSLAAPVRIDAVTIDHVPKEVASDMRSAPREMELWALVEGAENLGVVRAWREARQEMGEELEPYPVTLPRNAEYVRVANFTYDIHAPRHIQTFPVRPEVQELGIDFGVVVLMVKSNWGKEYTCLYRMRVHGEHIEGAPSFPTPEFDQ